MERIGEWDVLLAYDFARLARNQEDLGWIRNRLRVQRKQAIEASTRLDLDNVGARVMGVMSEEYLEKVRHDTHRGLRGRFDRKLSTGGDPFGYRTVPIVVGQDGHGHPVTEGYRVEVDPEEASTVVRIFEGYAHQGSGPCAGPSAQSDGSTCRAQRLGADRDPGDASEPDLSRRADLEPLLLDQGPRHGAPPALRASRERVGAAAGGGLENRLG
jgi:DNA invertase Pin-like site-specific DNA recombinase